MVRDGRLQKTRIYPPLSDAIEHKFVKILIYYKLSLPAGRVGSQLAGIVNQAFSSFLTNSIKDFSLRLCDIHQKFLIENYIFQGKCGDSHEVNGLVHLK